MAAGSGEGRTEMMEGERSLRPAGSGRHGAWNGATSGCCPSIGSPQKSAMGSRSSWPGSLWGSGLRRTLW